MLIFDEVKTGFRVAFGGACECFGVRPDIGTYAKAMGNGYPVAAIAMTDKVADGWRSSGIAQAGTYSGNGIGVAAAAATIDKLATGEPHAQDREGRAEPDGGHREGARRTRGRGQGHRAPGDVLGVHR